MVLPPFLFYELQIQRSLQAGNVVCLKEILAMLFLADNDTVSEVEFVLSAARDKLSFLDR